jgi:hypothetical protein
MCEELGITNGWYIYPNDDNDNGILLNVYHTTKCYVKVKWYNYYDNTYNLNTKEGLNYMYDLRRNLKVSNVISPFKEKAYARCCVLNPQDKLPAEQYISP